MGNNPLRLGPVEGGRAGAPEVQSAPLSRIPITCPRPPPPCAPPPFPSPFLPHPSPLQAGVTPLHVAAECDHAPVVALLLATPGVDPLALYVRGTQRRLCGLLFFQCPSLLPQFGRTPLDLAQSKGAAAALLRADPRVAAALAAAGKA